MTQRLLPANQPLTIWTNAGLSDAASALLDHLLGTHRLVRAKTSNASNLTPGGADPLLAEADVAFGQPDPDQITALPRVKWVHLTTAGYTRYDRDDLRAALKARGGVLTTSSGVYSEPCAQHALAMILSLSRQLPQSLDEQRGDRGWRILDRRANSVLLNRQTALLYGYGSIARRLTELLAPLDMSLIGVRRSPTGKEPIRVVATDDADALLPSADHVVNILPDAAGTKGYFDARRIALFKPGATFYNIGRGTTVDQAALEAALRSGKLRAAYLDVTDPEPLPRDHPLWTTPNCFITPHTAGGMSNEHERLVSHFAMNLGRLEWGGEPVDRII